MRVGLTAPGGPPTRPRPQLGPFSFPDILKLQPGGTEPLPRGGIGVGNLFSIGFAMTNTLDRRWTGCFLAIDCPVSLSPCLWRDDCTAYPLFR